MGQIIANVHMIVWEPFIRVNASSQRAPVGVAMVMRKCRAIVILHNHAVTPNARDTSDPMAREHSVFVIGETGNKIFRMTVWFAHQCVGVRGIG